MTKPIKYFLLGVFFWVTVDYTTVFNPDFGRWVALMPAIWLYYLGVPLLFSYLIYKRNFRGRTLFLTVLGCMVFCELIFFHNKLLVTFPIMLIMVPLAVSIYAFITYVPMWITDGTLKNHKWWAIILTLIWLVVAILNYATNTAT